MGDSITLLPDHIANQIAAGEVIQRPASAVKELMENAIDAGASEIRVFINDAGKSLVQVIDNGKGMSETDARICFERHATSKIKNIEDLFQIRTMGFRGEALASIAGVAEVELKTRLQGTPLGTYVELENSVVRTCEPVATPEGTSIAMKNLFFNIPARRNFLKSNPSELRHIVEEFIRISMSFPGIFFSLSSNGQEVYHLEKGSLKQRLIQILGNGYQSNLVSVREETDYLNIYGFVGKPDTAKKTRGDQYFFVNNRFIKSAYLNHAVMHAFTDLIPKDSFPLYALFIELDPSRLDINVHPTKQEIKFEDEKIIYAFVQAAVKHALAQYSVTPTLDFDLDATIQQSDAVSKPFTAEKQYSATSSSLYRTFTQKNQAHFIDTRSNLDPFQPEGNVEKILTGKFGFPQPGSGPAPSGALSSAAQLPRLNPETPVTQLHKTYLAVETPGGFLVIHQQNAHERILYERYAHALKGKPIPIQRSLFPATLETSPADAVLIQELLEDFHQLGYQVEPFGKNTFVIQGTPSDITEENQKGSLEKIVEQYKHFNMDGGFSKREKLLRSMAIQRAVRAGTPLSQKEMQVLVEDLLACESPATTPNGKPVFLEFKKEELDKMFGR